jgi:hypothetical protein
MALAVAERVAATPVRDDPGKPRPMRWPPGRFMEAWIENPWPVDPTELLIGRIVLRPKATSTETRPNPGTLRASSI